MTPIVEDYDAIRTELTKLERKCGPVVVINPFESKPEDVLEAWTKLNSLVDALLWTDSGDCNE